MKINFNHPFKLFGGNHGNLQGTFTNAKAAVAAFNFLAAKSSTNGNPNPKLFHNGVNFFLGKVD